MQTAYENLFLEFERHVSSSYFYAYNTVVLVFIITNISSSQRITSDIQIDCLTRKLGETDRIQKCLESTAHNTNSTSHSDENTSFRDSDAINVIKKLQEKVFLISYCTFPKFLLLCPYI